MNSLRLWILGINAIWLLSISTISAEQEHAISNSSNRTKLELKSLWNLNEMAECKLHYSAIDYNDYGCWCGVGGSGKPADGIDACCMAHDKCYDAAVDTRICYDIPEEYVDPYSWSCNAGEPTCSATSTGCGEALCQCDKMVVDCWSKYPKPAAKVKCSHEKSLLERMVDALRAVGSFFASIPQAFRGLFN